MGTGDQLEVIDVVELGCDLGAEKPSSTSGGDSPGVDVLGVGPHQIAERPFVRDLNLAIDCPDLVDGLDLRAESAVHAEDLAVDDRSNGQVIEHLGAVLPRIGVAVFPINLVVKSINSGNLPE